MPLIDSHCHLHYDFTPKTTEALLQEATENGISHLITVGVDMKTLDQVVAVSEKFPNVFHTVGVHPHDAKDMADGDLEILRRAAAHPKCKAIGEIGLDYYYNHSDHEIQKQRLREQLNLALEVKLPVVIHARDAEPDLLVIFEEYVSRLPKGRIPGVLHCFTGTYPFGQKCVDMGFYVSFSGILTFKNSDDLRSTARALPIERMLVETDCPYLAPIPMRGKKCEPYMVKYTAAKLAEVKNISLEDLTEITSANTKKVFNF